MRNHVRTVLWVSALATLSLTGSFPAARIAAQAGDRSDVLITFTDPPGPAEQALVRAAGGQIAHTYRLVPGMAASLPSQAVAALLKNPRIKAIEPDVRVFATDVELTSSWGVERIGAGLVHQTGNRGADVKIAIIDSGIDYTHPDLAANYAGGRDFVNNDDDPMDDNGHGTHVAGSAAARDNDSGVVGAAPEARLYAVKVLNENGTGSISTVIAALDWAVLHGMQVTNNSYGTSVDPGTLTKDAFDRAEAAGLLNIAAAGNEGNCAGTGDNVAYPARYSSVVAVAATTPDDLSPCFSSTGPDVELSAPGYEVNSTLPGETYGAHSGTSMASPHVAGTAALIITAGVVDVNGNGRVNDEVRRILDCTARDLGTSGRDSWYGFGLVDAAAAVAATSLVPGCAFVSVTTDKTIYFSGVDTTGQLSVVVTDESGAGVAGLSPAAFATTLDGGSSVSPADNFRETAPATYSWSIDVPTALGPHTIVGTVNYGDVSGGGSAVFDVVQPNLMHVPFISYSLDGGPKSSRNLRITVPVRDGAGAPIAQAAVSVVVRRNGTVHSTGTAITNSAGNSIFELKNAPSGRYQTQITGVNKTGMNWDQLTPPNEFIK